MAGNTNKSVSRPPAARVGGQRRRLSRNGRVPRSNTVPILKAESSSGGSSSVGSSLAADSQEGAIVTNGEEGATSLKNSQSMMNFCMLPSEDKEEPDSDCYTRPTY
jgi:hypothetical protein